MILDLLFTLFLVLLNGFFVAAEFAIVKVRMSQIEMLVRTGNRFAVTAKHIIEHLDSYLSATQVGITLASLGLGWVGEPVVAEIIAAGMSSVGIQIPIILIHQIAFTIAFILISAFHIILGELAPKSIAIQYSETIALVIALPLRGFYIVFKPFIWSLNRLSTALLHLVGLKISREGELHSADELRYLLEESSKVGVLESDEHELLENVFEFRETTANQIMVPRRKIVGLEISMPGNSIIEKVMEEGYSRMPVYRDTIDTIIGVVYAKDLVTMMSHRDLILLQDILRPAFFVQETEKISKLMRDMQTRRAHMAIVLDEFGGTGGIVTFEDIMEELVGEIQDEYDDEISIVEKRGEEWFVRASAPIADVNEYLPEPLPEDGEYETIGGWINQAAGRIPEANEVILTDGYECTIIQRSKRSVESVKLRLIEVQPDENQ
ncbi:MAG: HlyC/CorC family transporter [Ignavibacteriae bacterium]|nr:HlyC/CorC family transporter [Ignavibacteriota bacterium]